MNYKVVYHDGAEEEFAAKSSIGRLTLESGALLLKGTNAEICIPLTSLRSAAMFRLRGLSRLLKVSHSGGTVYLAVIRFNFFGLFVWVNFLATGRLKRELEDLMFPSPTEET